MSYGLTDYDFINISLFDISGKKIETIYNGMHESGYFEITLSSENLNSGIYIVTLTTSNKITSRKITVIK